MKKIDEENMSRLHDWCAMHGIIYVQWYPYDNCSGYYIENPSEDALEKFYENVNASDPYHRSFVLNNYKVLIFHFFLQILYRYKFYIQNLVQNNQ